MTASALRTLARVHAGLAWGAAVLLCVALVVLWRRPRGAARWASLAAAVGTGAGAFATGLAMHAPFQSKLRQRLFLASSTLGWLFERKEHAAFGAIGLLGFAACAAWAERVASGREDATAALLRRAVAVSLAGALLFEAFAIAASIPAAGRVSF